MKPEANQRSKRTDKRVIVGLILTIIMISPITLCLLNHSSFVNEFHQPVNQVSVAAGVPILILTFTTRTMLIDTPVQSGDILAGDHVTLKSEWQPTVNNSRLEVHAPAIPSVLVMDENQSILEMDTRPLGNNATCSIIASTQLENGTVVSVEFEDVYIGNFFMPAVQVISPNGGENWTSLHNITWTASDVNADDTLRFDVLYSDNSGASFVTLVESSNLTWFEWDCSSLDMKDNYTVKVRATDGIYFSFDWSDEEFSAGTVVTTTPTTTTTTTPDPGIESRIAAFIAILLFSSGIIALVVYYAARKWV